jgi:hypothetical protein
MGRGKTVAAAGGPLATTAGKCPGFFENIYQVGGIFQQAISPFQPEGGRNRA